MNENWMEQHRDNVRDVILRCMAACMDEAAPGFTGVVRQAAEQTLAEWPDSTPPHMRAFADEETRRLIDLILPPGEAQPEPPEGPRAPRRGRRS
jgi:hypothetical protein